MTEQILNENEKRRHSISVPHLICFAMFCFWQMGFIYFMGPSLTIDGRTPLPVSMDNLTSLIALSYVLSILCMSFIPHKVVFFQKILCSLSLVTALCLFVPLPEDILRFLIYSHVFFCCFMIGFETFIIANLFTEDTAIVHLTLAYSVSLFLIAIVQNDFIPISFHAFRFATVAAVGMLLYFCFKLPYSISSLPIYAGKDNSFTPPKKIIISTLILIFISALMAVSGPSISGEFTHGVFITYLVNALASILIYSLYKKMNIHPFRSISVCMALGALGFLLMHASVSIPGLKYLGCALIGCGMVPCQFVPLYTLMLMKLYPSRWFSPSTIGLALVAVLVQGSMVEIFRNMPDMLYLVYSIIMVALIMIYFQLAPHLLYTFRKKSIQIESGNEASDKTVQTASSDCSIPSSESSISTSKEPIQADDPFSLLTKREREIVNLIGFGYSANDMAKMLFISEYTVRDHTKNIYRKLNVHSRFELTALINKMNEK